MVRLMKIPDDFDFSTSVTSDAVPSADVTSGSTAAASTSTQLLWDVDTTIVHYQLTEEECVRLEKDEHDEEKCYWKTALPMKCRVERRGDYIATLINTRRKYMAGASAEQMEVAVA
ncbi:hypothetical protein MRX96_051721 [Rhipicephalus microplus]